MGSFIYGCKVLQPLEVCFLIFLVSICICPAMLHGQQEDLMGLGRIVLALACNTALALQQQNMAHALEFVQRNYSPDLKNLIL